MNKSTSNQPTQPSTNSSNESKAPSLWYKSAKFWIITIISLLLITAASFAAWNVLDDNDKDETSQTETTTQVEDDETAEDNETETTPTYAIRDVNIEIFSRDEIRTKLEPYKPTITDEFIEYLEGYFNEDSFGTNNNPELNDQGCRYGVEVNRISQLNVIASSFLELCNSGSPAFFIFGIGSDGGWQGEEASGGPTPCDLVSQMTIYREFVDQCDNSQVAQQFDIIDNPNGPYPVEEGQLNQAYSEFTGLAFDYPAEFTISNDRYNRESGFRREIISVQSPGGPTVSLLTNFGQFGGGECEEDQIIEFKPIKVADTDLRIGEVEDVDIVQQAYRGTVQLMLENATSTDYDSLRQVCPNTEYFGIIFFEYENPDKLEYGQYPNYFTLGASWPENDAPSQEEIDQMIEILASVKQAE